MKLVVGLGNPGSKYSCTLHNAGFWALDVFLRRQKTEATRKKANSLVVSLEIDGANVLFAKPQTFMNVSGEAVAPLARSLYAQPEEILIIHDEADLDSGRIQLKFGGGTGGHNGLESIVERLGNNDFYRLRLGIGKDPTEQLADYVLRSVPTARMKALGEHGADAMELILRDGPKKAMNAVNSPAFQRVPAPPAGS